jgi:hypothetical protein
MLMPRSYARERVCAWTECGATFRAVGHVIYCTVACRLAHEQAARSPVTLVPAGVCAYLGCAQPLAAGRPHRQRFCSSACRYAERRIGTRPVVRLEPKPCDYCTVTFTPGQASARFCSRRCRDAAAKGRPSGLVLARRVGLPIPRYQPLVVPQRCAVCYGVTTRALDTACPLCGTPHETMIASAAQPYALRGA